MLQLPTLKRSSIGIEGVTLRNRRNKYTVVAPIRLPAPNVAK